MDYPDGIALSKSPSEVWVRSPRWTPAAERKSLDGEDVEFEANAPPWTTKSIKDLIANYDTYANLFPEMRELDHVGRLLLVGTWLAERKEQLGDRLDLDDLLDVELPPCPTPRSRYQAFISYAVDWSDPPQTLVFSDSAVARLMEDRRRSGELDRLYRTWRERNRRGLFSGFRSLFVSQTRRAATRYAFEHALMIQVHAQAAMTHLSENAIRVIGNEDSENVALKLDPRFGVTGGLTLDLREKHRTALVLNDREKELIGRILERGVLRLQTNEGVVVYRASSDGPSPTRHPPLSGGFPIPDSEFGPLGGRRETPIGKTDRMLVLSGGKGERLEWREAHRSPVSDAPSRTIFLAEVGAAKRSATGFARYEAGRSVAYELGNFEGIRYQAKALPSGARDVESQVRSAAIAATTAVKESESRSPHAAWRGLVEGVTSVAAIHVRVDGDVAILTRDSGTEALYVVRDGIIRGEETIRGPAARQMLVSEARSLVEEVSDQSVAFVHISKEGDSYLMKVGAQAISLSSDQLGELASDPRGARLPNLDQLFLSDAMPTEYVVYRDALDRRPHRFGGSLQKGPTNPLRLALALNERYSGRGRRVSLDDDPAKARDRIASIVPIRNPGEDLALLIPNESFRVQHRGALSGVTAAWRREGLQVHRGTVPEDLAPNVAAVTGHNERELFEYLEDLGQKGLLRNRYWLLFTCGEPGNENMFHELMDRHGALGFEVFGRTISAQAVAEVLKALPEVVRNHEGGSINPRDLRHAAIERAIERIRANPGRPAGTADALLRELEGLRRGTTQISQSYPPSSGARRATREV